MVQFSWYILFCSYKTLPFFNNVAQQLRRRSSQVPFLHVKPYKSRHDTASVFWKKLSDLGCRRVSACTIQNSECNTTQLRNDGSKTILLEKWGHMTKRWFVATKKKSFVASLFWVKLHESQAAYFDPGVVMELIVVLPIGHHCGKGICSLSSYSSLEKRRLTMR